MSINLIIENKKNLKIKKKDNYRHEIFDCLRGLAIFLVFINCANFTATNLYQELI